MKIEINIDKTFIKKLFISIAVIASFTLTALYLNKQEEEKREHIRKIESILSEQREAWYETNTNWKNL